MTLNEWLDAVKSEVKSRPGKFDPDVPMSMADFGLLCKCIASAHESGACDHLHDHDGRLLHRAYCEPVLAKAEGDFGGGDIQDGGTWS